MGRRSDRPDKFYCPKCGKKELLRIYEHPRYFWECQHYAPSKKPWLRGAKKLKEHQVACGLVIKNPDRHAEISDYTGDVLDRLAAVEEGSLLKHHLLTSNPNIHKRGLEVLYAGELLDLVRLNDNQGIAAYIIFRETWEDGRTKFENRFTLTGGAARYIKFRDVPLSDLCRDKRYCLWTLRKTYSAQCAAPFKGKMLKKMRTDMIKWAADLDTCFLQLQAKAIVDHERWTAEHKALQAQIIHPDPKRGSHAPYTQLESYCGERSKVMIKVQGWITPEQAKAIAAIVNDSSAVNS